jgi:hypothetical protein
LMNFDVIGGPSTHLATPVMAAHLSGFAVC